MGPGSSNDSMVNVVCAALMWQTVCGIKKLVSGKPVRSLCDDVSLQLKHPSNIRLNQAASSISRQFGILSVKTVPSPVSELTSIVPPSVSTISLVIYKPNPLPAALFVAL